MPRHKLPDYHLSVGKSSPVANDFHPDTFLAAMKKKDVDEQTSDSQKKISG